MPSNGRMAGHGRFEDRHVLVLGEGPLAEMSERVLANAGARLRRIDLGDRETLEGLIAGRRGPDVAVLVPSLEPTPGYLDRSGRIEQTTLESFTDAVETLLDAPFQALQVLARAMSSAGSGRIIFVLPTSARRSDPFRGYGEVATGAGLVNVARQAALELAPAGVAVDRKSVG